MRGMGGMRRGRETDMTHILWDTAGHLLDPPSNLVLAKLEKCKCLGRLSGQSRRQVQLQGWARGGFSRGRGWVRGGFQGAGVERSGVEGLRPLQSPERCADACTHRRQVSDDEVGAVAGSEELGGEVLDALCGGER
jgi:hypothetical protein